MACCHTSYQVIVMFGFWNSNDDIEQKVLLLSQDAMYETWAAEVDDWDTQEYTDDQLVNILYTVRTHGPRLCMPHAQQHGMHACSLPSVCPRLSCMLSLPPEPALVGGCAALTAG